MSKEIINFSELDTHDKILICNQCQKILGEHFPDSEYTLTKKNMAAGLGFYRKLIDGFKGNVFKCKDAIVFYKRNNIENPHDKQGEFLRIYKGEHINNGNCIFVEFMAADISPENLEDLESFFIGDKRVEYIMASRRGTIYFETVHSLRERSKRIQDRAKFISSLVP